MKKKPVKKTISFPFIQSEEYSTISVQAECYTNEDLEEVLDFMRYLLTKINPPKTLPKDMKINNKLFE